MGCTRGIKDDSYDFFDNINEYIKYSDNVLSDGSQLDSRDDCNSFSKQYTSNNTDIGKRICEQFIKLCKQLPNVKNNNIQNPNYRNDWNFLSFWLNSKLRESELNGTICPNDFYEGMETHCTQTLLQFLSQTKLIYNIKEEDLSRMNVLYVLHENYSKLYTILNVDTSPEANSLLEPSSTCYNYYKRVKYMCYGENNKFCEKLKKFKSEYDKLFITAETKGKEFANNFKKLTDYDNSNIISTTLIGSAVGLIPLLGILYKFTPMGQIFRSKNKNFTKGYSNNNDDPISLHQERYNIKYHSVAE